MVRGRPRGSPSSKSLRKKNSDWWNIKDIIDEDKARYLVKWEPHSRSGKSYPASWVPKRDVTDDAVRDWKLYKQRRVKPLSENRLNFNCSSNSPVLQPTTEAQEANFKEPEPSLEPSRFRVEISQHSSFPREDYPTQRSPPTQCSPPSSQTSSTDSSQSWRGSAQDSSGLIASRPSAKVQDSIPETVSQDSVILLPDDNERSYYPDLSSSLYPSNQSSQPLEIVPSSISTSDPLSPVSLAEGVPPSRQHDVSSPVYSSPHLSTVLESSQPDTSAGTTRSNHATQLTLLSHDRPATSLLKTMNSSTNGLRGSTAPSPPMQDRVRSIRNSALSSHSRRANGDAASSSRASSVVSEAPVGPTLSDIRLEVRTADYALPYNQLDSPPSDNLEAAMNSRHELNLAPAGENMEYWVSLPLPSRVRDQYSQTIQYFRKDMQSFLAGASDEAIFQRMRRLVHRLNNVSTHVDLENETPNTQQEISAQDEAKWALSSSTKFVFLETLLNKARQEKMHIVLVAVQSRLLDILERFLRGIEINYTRVDDTTRSKCEMFDGHVKVSIVAPQEHYELPQADAVIMLDSTASSVVEQVAGIRSHATRHGLAPVIFPVVYCSVGHLSRCIERVEDIVTEDDRLRALITAIDERQVEVGGIADEEYRPEASGEETYHFLAQDIATPIWTGLPVRLVKVIGLEQFLSRASQPDEDSVDAARQHRSETPNIRKRALEDDMYGDTEQPKRQRCTPVPDAAGISEESVGSSEIQTRDLRLALERTEKALAEKNTEMTVIVDGLEATIAEMERSLQDYHQSMDDLQARFEKSKRGYHRTRSEHDKLVQRYEAKDKQYEAAIADKEKLYDDVKRLNSELEEVRAQVANSSVPEVAELERFRQSNRGLSAAKEGLDRKIELLKKDFEFTREQYQVASSAAADSAYRVTELEEEIAKLIPKASGEATKLREMTDRSESEAHLAQLSKLRLENEELKEQLRRKERGRGMTTRTGSVAPRSPRLGASPGPGRSRAGSRAPGSRPSSPVRNLFGARKSRNIVEQAM